MAATLDDEGRKRVEAHLGVARRAAFSRWRRRPWLELDELESVAFFWLCRASAWWKGEGTFVLFAAQFVGWGLNRELARRRRQRDHESQFDGDDFGEDTERSVPAPDQEDDDVVHAAFARLGDRDKEILTRIVLRDESFAEAAGGLDVTKWAAVSATRTAKRRLRRLLAEPA